jgi:hypothetical protein
MERSEDINAKIIRIMKSMDRSNAILSRSIGYFESPHAFVEACLRDTQLVAGIRVGQKADAVTAVK